ncbi:trypco2 family protein [Nocardia sp. NPDC050710]|uniref:trypco2 family protein n=1 Tax=Nocardia sp. NPDC050710 TaxID=3157220 RepID=UPI0034103359
MTVDDFDKDGVELSVAIELLRSELADAITAGQGQRVRFVAESIELELELGAKVTRKADGKLTLWRVLSLGGGADSERAAKHRLKLVLKPRDTALAAGDETLIGDDDE